MNLANIVNYLNFKTFYISIMYIIEKIGNVGSGKQGYSFFLSGFFLISLEFVTWMYTFIENHLSWL